MGGVLVSIAGASQRLGRAAEAHERFLRAERVLARALGDSRPAVAEVRNCLGALCCERGDLRAALRWYHSALDVLAAGGAPELRLAAQHRRLGEVYRLCGDPRRALAFCQRALEARRRRLGPRHAAMGHVAVARLLVQLGDSDAALPHYLQASRFTSRRPGAPADTHADR